MVMHVDRFQYHLGAAGHLCDLDAQLALCLPILRKKKFPVHDKDDKQWHHLKFFKHECYLHARVHRVRCDACCEHLVAVLWGRNGRECTLLFEALAMAMTAPMPVAEVSCMVTEFDTQLWRIIRHHVEQSRARESHAAVERVGIDETARARGHAYVSVLVDLDTRRVLYAVPGRGQDAVAHFSPDRMAYDGDSAAVTDVSMYMTPAFIAGVESNLPDAAITFDRFHVMQLAIHAVDLVSREELKTVTELKRSRHLWLKNPDTLRNAERDPFAGLSLRNLKTVRAWNLRMSLHTFWDQNTAEAAAYLMRWYRWASRSRLDPMVHLARAVHRHWHGILHYVTSGVNNDLVEGINSKIQLARSRARWYRSVRNYITMIDLVAGRLQYELTT